MNELRGVWRNTRLVVFTAICAALYAAILIPFKVMPIIPGVTEFRPANAVPIVCSLLFGPAAAWGSAIGNLIGDLFSGIGPGDFFGFCGNFLYGLVPYRAWEVFSRADPVPRSASALCGLLAVAFVAAAACALVIAWGLNLLGFVPFPVLANLILWNDFVVAAVLAPLLLRGLYPRVKASRLLYRDVAGAPPPARSALRAIVLVLGVLATIGGHVAGNLIYAGRWLPPWVAVLPWRTASRAVEIGVGLAPFVAIAAASFVAL